MWKKEEAPGNFFGMKSVWPMSKTVTKNHNESKTENLQTAGKRWRGGVRRRTWRKRRKRSRKSGGMGGDEKAKKK